MGVIFELLVVIFQVVAKDSTDKESKQNKYVALGFFVALLLVVILIWQYNPAS
ncbi:hypothetical protein [Pedobacter psychroterrae]|uniref:hypothetical protein n=1 Tax=Pedobacter psychroterrae TaxID=2530453 RepID=UPI0013F14921|nr:hypothetical protein [Pedobacter psychroterrae]